MADLSITYHASKPQYDVDAIKVEVLYDFLPENVKSNVDKFIADVVDLNNQQEITEKAIKVPYQGSTDAERNKWLADRIEAIYKRLDLIKSDVEGNKNLITDLGGQSSEWANSTLQILGSVLSLVPVTRPIGLVTSVIGKLVNRSNNNMAYKQQKINDANFRIYEYGQDVAQLKPMLEQFTSEFKEAPNTNDPSYNAGTPIPVWYYYIGAVVIILLLVYAKNRRKGR